MAIGEEKFTNAVTNIFVKCVFPMCVFSKKNISILIGGFDGTNYLHSVEIYDPVADSWRPNGSMRFISNYPIFSIYFRCFNSQSFLFYFVYYSFILFSVLFYLVLIFTKTILENNLCKILKIPLFVLLPEFTMSLLKA